MKRLLVMLMVFAMLMSFAGCSKTTSWTVTFNDGGAYSLTFGQTMTLKSASANIDHVDFSVDKEGEYSFIVLDEDNKEYTLTFILKGGNGEIKADPDLSVTLTKK